MSHRGLADFLETLIDAGELARIETPVAATEAGIAAARLAPPSHAPATLFSAVEGHELPLLTGLLATEGRVLRALGAESLEAAAVRVEEALKAQSEGGLDRTRPWGSRSLAPRVVRNGACQQVVRLGTDVDLSRLPVPWAHGQPGPVLTAAQVWSVEPASRHRALGRYDLLVMDRNRLVLGWLAQDDAARLLAEYRRRRERMPVAAVLGGDPTCLLAAMAPTPCPTDGALLTAILRTSPLELVNGRSIDVAVPTEADLVIEGYVDPAEALAAMGPVVLPSGLVSHPWPAPVMHVTGLTHRANPVFPWLKPAEKVVMVRAMLRVMLPWLRAAVPGLVDLDLPEHSGARHACVVAIQKTHAGQARQVAGALWSLQPTMFAKTLTVVEEGIDVRHGGAVLAEVAGRVDAGRDVFFVEGPPDPLDAASPPDRLARRMGIDATAKLPEERTSAASPLPDPSAHVRR